MSENLYKRGNVWWGRVQVYGKDVRRSLRCSDKATARARLKRWQEELQHERFHGEERPTWRQAVGRWAAEYLPSSVKPTVQRRYIVSIRKFDGLFGDLYVDQVTTRMISRFVSQERARKVTNATIRRDLTAASSVLRCCVVWGWREDNPAKLFDRDVIRERRDPIRLPSDADVLAAILAAPQMLGRLMLALLQTGAREEEIASLEHAQIQPGFTDVLLTVTKSNRPRMVPLSKAAAGTLAGTPRNIATRYVFWHEPTTAKAQPGQPARDSKPMRYASVAPHLAKIIDRGINPEWHRKLPEGAKRPPKKRPTFRAHDLRHKFAVEWLRENPGGIYQLSRILGHSSVKTTEIYLAYLAQNPAQEQRLAAEWPYDKPLKELSYDELFTRRTAASKQVL